MTTAQIKAEVKRLCPQAQYMNLSDSVGPCHCIDDGYNDRYLAYSQPSRRKAWYAALAALNCATLAEERSAEPAKEGE